MTEHYSTIWQTLKRDTLRWTSFPFGSIISNYVHFLKPQYYIEGLDGGEGGGGLCGCRCLCQLSVIIMSIRKLQLNFGSSSSCQLSGCMLII